MIARSARFGTKYVEPQCRSEKCAILNSRGLPQSMKKIVGQGRPG
jgi:hypothetical protein